MATRTKSAAQENGVPNASSAAVPPVSTISFTIPKIMPGILDVWIDGVTPLLVCAWSEKARNMILNKQMKKALRGKEAKDPHQNYLDALYVSTEGWTGIPAGGLKGCLVNACRAVDELPMTMAKRMLFIQAQGYTKSGQGLVRIHGEHEMNEAMVRIDQGTADIRHRPIYKKWSIRLTIEYLQNILSAEQVLNLLELAGYIEGLCEHRPGSPKNNTGDNGRFTIRRVDE